MGLKRLRGQVSASWSPFVTWRRSPCSDHHASEVPHCWEICFRLSEKGHKRHQGTEEQVTVVSCHPHILFCWRVGCERPPLRPPGFMSMRCGGWGGIHALRPIPGLKVLHRGKPLCRPGWLATLPMKVASVLGPHTKCPLSEAERPTATDFLCQQKLEALLWRKAVAFYHLGAYPLGQKYWPWSLRMDSYHVQEPSLITGTDTG